MEAEKILSKYFRPEMIEDSERLVASGRHELVVSSWFDENGNKNLETAGVYTKENAITLAKWFETEHRIPGAQIIKQPPEKRTNF